MLCFDVFCVVFFSFPGLVMGSGFDYVSIGFIFSCLWFSQSHQAGILRIAISLILGVVTTVAPPTHPADQLAMFQSVHRVVLGPTKGLPPRKPIPLPLPKKQSKKVPAFLGEAPATFTIVIMSPSRTTSLLKAAKPPSRVEE